MSWEQTKVEYFSHTDTSANDQTTNFSQKPIEIYYFINPFCQESWSLEPYLKKLAIEYGRYFTIRPLITKDFFTINKAHTPYVNTCHMKQLQFMIIQQAAESKKETLSPWNIALAIKAAELQGKNAGRKFLRKIQQALFLKDIQLYNRSLLYRCAKLAKLDVVEFKKDLFSATARRALLCDLKIAHEMNVQQAPTIVFINSLLDEQGIKVSGLYSYDIYTHVFMKTLKDDPVREDVPKLNDYIANNEIVTTEEVSIVYDWSLKKAENELKKLTLQQIVAMKKVNSQVIWTYTAT